VECVFEDAALSLAKLDNAVIKNCQFVRAYLNVTHFIAAQVQGGDWKQVDLHNSTWTDAQVQDVCFQQACFSQARLHNARFVNCDFTLVDIKGAVAHDTVFERCDFRYVNFQNLQLKNTLFSQCGFYGCIGTPLVEGEYKVISPDLSENFDGTVIVEPEQISQLWGLGTTSQQPPEWMAYVSRSRQHEHFLWVDAGRTGDGRIDIEGKNLNRPFLNEAYLKWARFVGCHFILADLRRARVMAAEFINCTFDSALLMSLQAEKAHFQDCQAIGTCLNDSDLRGATISGGDWTGATFRHSMWSEAVVENVCFRNTIWKFANCPKTRFISCNFTGADLEEIEAGSCVFEGCDFRGANLRGMGLAGKTIFKDCRFYNCRGIVRDFAKNPIYKSQVIAPDLSESGDGTGVVETIYDAESFFRQLNSRYLQS
jgi:uncharacterized protein YjbI with pentapeptide repeats